MIVFTMTSISEMMYTIRHRFKFKNPISKHHHRNGQGHGYRKIHRQSSSSSSLLLLRHKSSYWIIMITICMLFLVSIQVYYVHYYFFINIPQNVVISNHLNEQRNSNHIIINTNNNNNNWNHTITKNELQTAERSLFEAKQHNLRPLNDLDKSKYSVRINTWRRNEQLITSVHHLATCSGVAQIVIVWCDDENKPPQEIFDLIRTTGTGTSESNMNNNDDNVHQGPLIQIEYHKVNSLNERFNVMIEPITKGVLSVDDDVLRPCDAIDDGFFRWTDHPDRMLGYDYRLNVIDTTTHIMDDEQLNINNTMTWSYGGLTATRENNLYSMVLTRFSFIHVDYLNLYMKYIPRRIFDTVGKTFNCEDIAMSLFVSSLTDGQVPLLANEWSLGSMVKLSSPNAISQGSEHKELRHKCVNDYGHLLGLKDGFAGLSSEQQTATDVSWHTLKQETIWHGKRTAFGIGANISQKPLHLQDYYVPRRRKFVLKIREWVNHEGGKSFHDSFQNLRNKVLKLGLLNET